MFVKTFLPVYQPFLKVCLTVHYYCQVCLTVHYYCQVCLTVHYYCQSASLSTTTARSSAYSNFRRISLVLAFLLITSATASRCQIWIYPIFPVRILLYILSLHTFLRPFSPPPLGHPSTSTRSWPYLLELCRMPFLGLWIEEPYITVPPVSFPPVVSTWTSGPSVSPSSETLLFLSHSPSTILLILPSRILYHIFRKWLSKLILSRIVNISLSFHRVYLMVLL